MIRIELLQIDSGIHYSISERMGKKIRKNRHYWYNRVRNQLSMFCG